jgi:transcriptional regulator with XRE-family HTH domain
VIYLKHHLSENIRIKRKARKLTQEQLAEAMNVTVGAVSKWELGLSIPEINMLINLATFFDSSVDALLGYELNYKKEEIISKNLKELRDNKEFDLGISEFERETKKFPNSFLITFQGAKLYQLYGVETENKDALIKSISLYNRAIELLDQNNADEISEVSLKINIAEVYLSLSNMKEALDILKKNNVKGINSALIGTIYATTNMPDEAVGYLSEAFINNLYNQFKVTIGYINIFMSKKDYFSGIEIINWQLNLFKGIETSEETSSIDKTKAVLYAAKAIMYFYNGQIELSKVSLIEAKNTAIRFDRNPKYDCRDLKYYYKDKPAIIYDDFGETAISAIEKILDEDDVPKELIDIWNSL